MQRILVCATLCALAMTAPAEFADYRFIAPAKSALTVDPTANAIGAATVSKLGAGAVPRYEIEDYAGQAGALKLAAETAALQVGVGADLGWDSADLVEGPEKDGGQYVWRAAITSVDATALRVLVNLDALGPDEELWVVDTTGAFAFGPYTLADATDHARWLPTTMGDTTVLVLRSPRSVVPNVRIEALSHHFESLVSKQMDCPLSADCSDNATLREVSTGIGRLSISDDTGKTFLCSGALLNNATTEDLEGLFLTADHCFQDAPGTIFADGIEVIWDLRTNGCPGSEPSSNVIAALPRSAGVAFLRNSATIDGMLLRLGRVPVGALGRAYLGWDTRVPRVGDASVGVHHPGGKALKECIGRVNNINVNTVFGQLQTSISWDEGITEGGSSGSPVMFDDANFRVFGMLSNGNFQSCRTTGTRRDQYSSFRELFALSSGFLNQATPPDAGRTTYGASGGGGGLFTGCVLEEQSLESAAGNLLVAALAISTLLGMAAIRRP